jgi:carbamoyltransferase
MARHAHDLTGAKNLCLAGGVALNCVANGRLLREGPFERLWIQPAAGDAGGALGAGLFVWHQLLENERRPAPEDGQNGSLLGPAPSSGEIETVLREAGAVYRKIDDEASLCAETAAALAAGEVVGWVQGRMEFGPRALGARSILGDARDPGMQRRMNLKTKFRESFRPFAPVVRRERAAEYFELKPGEESPYMLIVAPVRPERRRRSEGASEEGLDRVNAVRSEIPAVTHVDYSARIQTADAGRAPRLCRLLEAFEARTGCPVLINTSFNIRGEPIVCTAADALRCFLATDLDRLVLGDFVIRRTEQPDTLLATGQAHRARFGDD